MTHGKNNHLIAACMDEKGKAVNQQGKAREKKKKTTDFLLNVRHHVGGEVQRQ